MTLRARLSLWYAGIMFVSLLLMGTMTYRAFAPGPPVSGGGRNDEWRQDEDNANDLRDILRILFWCGVPPALLALVGGWWLMNTALAPVATLTQAAERLNERNLGERLTGTGNGDEFDRLTEVFNSMSGRLQHSFSRIREFTLHASHELKTPLAVLRGQLETALRDEPLSPAGRELYAGQLEELRRLTRIVDSLSLLAKADAGLVPLSFAPVRFDELVREIFADAEILAEPSRIRVNLDAGEPATLSGDAHRLRQLLLNLADNAVKYSEPGGSVTMALRTEEGTAEFSIANTGPGIPAAVLPRVFDRFYRGDAAHSSAVEGCGLGLSIVQWIVAAHSGIIRIESTPGTLTTVTVRLPLALEKNNA